jgi:sirohydrochlorin cobaltochelatase
MARWVQEASDHELVDIAFTGITWPRLETVVQRQARLGMTQIVVLPVYLFTGVLLERIRHQVTRLRETYPSITFALGQHIGFDVGIFELLDQRVAGLRSAMDGTLGGSMMLECDGCRYREFYAQHNEHSHEHA